MTLKSSLGGKPSRAWEGKRLAGGHSVSHADRESRSAHYKLWAFSTHLLTYLSKIPNVQAFQQLFVEYCHPKQCWAHWKFIRKHFILFLHVLGKKGHDRDINNISTFCLFQHFSFPFPPLLPLRFWHKQAFTISSFIKLTLKSIGRGHYESTVIFSWQGVESWYFSLRHSAVFDIWDRRD